MVEKYQLVAVILSYFSHLNDIRMFSKLGDEIGMWINRDAAAYVNSMSSACCSTTMVARASR